MTDQLDLSSLLNQDDDPSRQNEKLRKIVSSLMKRVEQANSDSNDAYTQFERAISLEEQVRSRTLNLREALDVLNAINGQLGSAQRETEKARQNLVDAVESIQEGFAIFDAHENLVMKNSKFLALLPDIADKVIPGTTFEQYIEISSSSEFITFPEQMSKDEWFKHRTDIHEKQSANFVLEIKDDHWMQVSEQRTEVGGTIVLQTDITDMMRLERVERARMLDRQGEIVKATLDHIDQAIIIFDEDGQLVGWNEPIRKVLNPPAKLLRKGTRRGRFEHIFTSGNVFSKRSYPEGILIWLRKNVGRNRLRQEMQAMNGQIYDVSCSEMPDGSCLVSFNDITQLRKLNETLEHRVHERTQELTKARDIAERANASKSRFVAAASHDLLQPINAAKLFISALSSYDLDDRTRDVVDRIDQSFQSVEIILGALLDISKLDSGKTVLNISTFPISSILDRLSDEYTQIARRKGIDLRIVSSSLLVRSDPTYLRRIVQNLASNAIRYTQSGKVVIGVKRKNGSAQIVVADTGIGIAKKDQDLIFREFHRINTEQSSNTAMGLGLAIVDRACQMLGHDLELESEVNVGTTFRVSVQYFEAERKDSLRDQEPGHLDIAPNKIAVLIENDANVLAAMVGLFESWGISTIGVTNIDDAQRELKSLEIIPDIVVADYQLDDQKNGVDGIIDIRATCGPVIGIILTADRSKEVQDHVAVNGIFLRTKPVDVDEFRIFLSRSLQEHTPRPTPSD